MRIRTVLIALAGASLLASCSPPPSGAAPPRAVLVRTVDGAAAPPAVQLYSGEVRARIETDLGFRVGGKLVERRVDVGTEVAAGALLALLDPADAHLAASAAQAALTAAEADLALARTEHARAQELAARQFVSSSVLDARRTALQAAEARLRQARAQADAAANQTGYTRLEAPAAGVVTAVFAEPGQVVGAGQPVFRLARPDEREVLIHVPEGRAAALRPGTPARVRTWAAPDREYAASVREVAPAADPATRTYALRVAVAQADAGLALGATASVAFAASADGGVLLPLAAVTRAPGRPDGGTVWVVGDDDTVRPLAVEVLAWREDGALLRAELPARTRLVVAGVQTLVEGETVRAVEEGAPVRLDVAR
ncbi:Macrolide export protein MacA [Thauera sp. GDN1]|uniref:efflux RND transporter periplasmic adaptor subunit n=1 Tax=Thauera sp. GDN1 TaxID=2944810 RepID=UPI00247AE282|nr:efflux RND transporter periplasmic adaptor subunit [Thauera sp. GDN1]WEN41189.1 Macrolide export protein MacA [Thauera sp. GDN1]